MFCRGRRGSIDTRRFKKSLGKTLGGGQKLKLLLFENHLIPHNINREGAAVLRSSIPLRI